MHAVSKPPNPAESLPPRARSRRAPEPLSARAVLLLRTAKVVVAGYWLWVLIAALRPQQGAFDALVVLSAPLLLSLHFVQGMMFVRLLRGRSPWWRNFLLILFFGVVHLGPLLRGSSAAPKRRP